MLAIQRTLIPWERGRGAMMFAMLGPFEDAIKFIFEERESQAGTVRVGGLGEMWELTWMHLKGGRSAVPPSCPPSGASGEVNANPLLVFPRSNASASARLT